MKLTKREEILLAVMVFVLVLAGGYFGYNYYKNANKIEIEAANKAAQAISSEVKTGNAAEMEKIKKEIEDDSLDMTELDNISEELNGLDLSSL